MAAAVRKKQELGQMHIGNAPEELLREFRNNLRKLAVALADDGLDPPTTPIALFSVLEDWMTNNLSLDDTKKKHSVLQRLAKVAEQTMEEYYVRP